MAEKLKGITCCADCAYYSMKKHRCIRGCTEKGLPCDHFYSDCPLPDVVEHNLIEQECVRPHGKIEWKKRTRLESIKDGIDECGTPFIKQKHITQDVPYCSCCGKRMTGTFLNFCDHCGAKMDGEGDTESADIT